MSSFAQRLRSLMAQNHLTQTALASAVGVSPAAVRRWLNDQALPSVTRRTAVAEALNIPEAVLFNDKETTDNASATKMLPLPIGSATFEALRDFGQLYVDKTALIYEFASKKQFFFIARPRRFGKTLLVSTLASLFAHGTRYFSGLAIEKLWKDKTYPVISLSFSTLQGLHEEELIRKQLVALLKVGFSRAGFKTEIKEFYPFLNALEEWLTEQPVNSLVLLIDEYDVLLSDHLDDMEMFKVVRAMMVTIFSILKKSEGVFRFFFMTGILKFSQTSIFSAFNSLQDLTFRSEFSALLGYTEEEVLHYFAPRLEIAQKTSGLSAEALLTRLRNEYDGYCFDLTNNVHVFNPWSLLNYLEYPSDGFKNYWYESGARSTLLLKYLTGTDIGSPERFTDRLTIPLEALSDTLAMDTIEPATVLTHAGYLTICAPAQDDEVALSFPNNEVRSSFASLYSRYILDSKSLGQHRLEPLSALLRKRTPEEVFTYFNKVVNVVNCVRFPLTNEAAVQAAFQFLMIGAKLNPIIEKHTASGRSDLEVTVGDRHWVFEFKYADDQSNPDKLLKEACAQIKEKRYGISPEERKLLRMALVFSKTDRSFVRWSLV